MPGSRELSPRLDPASPGPCCLTSLLVAGTRASAVPRQGTQAGGLQGPLAPGPAAGRSYALAGSRRTEAVPPDPRHASVSRGGREPAAPRARRQHQLAIVPVRRPSSPVTVILARSSGAASRGWGTEIGGGGAGDEAMGMSVGPRSFVTARVDDITGCRPEPIHIGRTRSFDHPI